MHAFLFAGPAGGLFCLLHCVRHVLPRGLRPCRSGGASSAALRPACACDRAGQSGGRSLAVPFATLRAGVSTLRSGRSGTRTLRRHRPPPAGRSWPPPPRLTSRAPSSSGAGALARAPQPPVRTLGLQQDLRVVGGGPSIRPSGEAAIAPEAAGRGRRSFGPQRAGASKARTPLHPRGKQESTQWKKNQSDLAAAGRRRRWPHASAEKDPGCPHPATGGSTGLERGPTMAAPEARSDRHGLLP
jgi:hypothetical protein